MISEKNTLIGHIVESNGATFVAQLISDEAGFVTEVTVGEQNVRIGQIGSYLMVRQSGSYVLVIVEGMWQELDADGNLVAPGGNVTLTVTDNNGATGSDSTTVDVVRDNAPPVADAGLDRVASPDQTVALDGSGSHDPDGGENPQLTFSWLEIDKPEGSTATLTGEDTDAPTVTVDLTGTYLYRLVVTDGAGAESLRQLRLYCAANVSGTAGDTHN